MTTEQLEQLKQIQDAYLEMRSKEVEEAFVPDSRTTEVGDSDKNKLGAITSLIKKSKTKKTTDACCKEEAEVFESQRSEKFKKISSSLDRMMAKAAENTKLQKNRAIKKPILPEEVEELDELFDKKTEKGKQKLNSYISKADDSLAKMAKDREEGRRPSKRATGLAKAINKRMKEEVELDEKELTDTDVKQKEKVVKGMKKNLQAFKDKYGDSAKGVMYATATKIAQKMPDVKEEVEELEELSKATLGSYVDKSRHDLYNKQIQYRNTGDMPERKKLQDKATKRGSGISKAVGKLTKEEVELEEGNFEKNMDTIKSGKLPPHIQAILDKRGAKGNDAIMAKGRAEKLKSMKEMLDEARAKKEPMELYHPSYSSAVQHAKAHAEKQGYEISDDDWHNNVTTGPGKPSRGKTTRHVIPLHKDGKLSKKGLAIQVHNRETDKNPYELNSYIN